MQQLCLIYSTESLAFELHSDGLHHTSAHFLRMNNLCHTLIYFLHTILFTEKHDLLSERVSDAIPNPVGPELISIILLPCSTTPVILLQYTNYSAWHILLPCCVVLSLRLHFGDTGAILVKQLCFEIGPDNRLSSFALLFLSRCLLSSYQSPHASIAVPPPVRYPSLLKLFQLLRYLKFCFHTVLLFKPIYEFLYFGH